jgi:Short C-terminal domain
MDTADALPRLQDLRNQGLITESEFAAKRSEILDRL